MSDLKKCQSCGKSRGTLEATSLAEISSLKHEVYDPTACYPYSAAVPVLRFKYWRPGAETEWEEFCNKNIQGRNF